jgi:hypothetical protein
MKTTIPRRRRCGARVRYHRKAIERYQLGQIDKAEVLHVLRRSDRCRNWALPGSARCRLHGGLSTGARTPDGRLRQAEGYRRWLERVRAEGRKPGPPKGTGGRPRGSSNPTPEAKARRELTAAALRLARARSLLGHALSSPPDHRRRRREARQEADREVQRLLAEHQRERRAIGLPPLLGEALERVAQGFRARVDVRVPHDRATRWPNIRDLQDRVRVAEDTLERAKGRTARGHPEAIHRASRSIQTQAPCPNRK